MGQRTLRASEISEFTYCRRAWFYSRQGYASEDDKRLRRGRRWHQEHGRQILAAGCLRVLGYAALIMAAVSLAVYLATLAVS